MKSIASAAVLLGMCLLLAGCVSPYHSDQGALAGGLIGTVPGAIVGHAMGNTAAGAVVGAGVGAVSGAAIGAGMDESEARNRAIIEQRMGQQIAAGTTNVPDVIRMSQAGVGEELIVNHVRARGLATPVTADEVIAMRQQGVSPRVIETMQMQPVAQPMVYGASPVVVEEGWGHPGYVYYYNRPHYYCPPPRVGVGFSFGR